MFVSDRHIRHCALALKDTVHAIVRDELDEDFERVCEEVREARVRRGETRMEAKTVRPLSETLMLLFCFQLLPGGQRSTMSLTAQVSPGALLLRHVSNTNHVTCVFLQKMIS